MASSIDLNALIAPSAQLGANVTVGPYCIIGDNVYVAAGAVVTKNLKSNTFVKGVPAKYAKKRMA